MIKLIKMKRALQEIECKTKFDGQRIIVYNKKTRKTIGYIVDKIDWRFVDTSGNEYRVADGYQDIHGKWISNKRYDVGSAINYFTSLYFLILQLRKGDDIMIDKGASLADLMCWIWFSTDLRTCKEFVKSSKYLKLTK